MNPTPPSPSYETAESEVLTADDFNLWCALNNMPFRMTEHVWPDGATEWDVEVHPGQVSETVAYGTGQSDEGVAAAMAFAFVAGVEWADNAHRAASEAEAALDEETDDRPMPPRQVGAVFTAPVAALAGGLDEAAAPSAGRGSASGTDDAGPEADDRRQAEGTLATAPTDAAADGAGGVPDSEPDPETAWQDDAWVAEDFDIADGLDADAVASMTDEMVAEPDEETAGALAAEPADDDRTAAAAPVPRRAEAEAALYSPPALDVLQDPYHDPERVLDEHALAEKARALETVLRNFKVRGEIMQVHQGPVITLYELEPIPGTKSSTVINLADDIARSMSAVTARIAVVPGRSVIGIELPNDSRETVYLKEILESGAFTDTGAKLPLALGKGIDGNPCVVDLSRMPHLLIAGTTGSGKSVGINAMILSLLTRMAPDRCRLIMVDPKMLELSVYDGIPHLLTPVVTDPNKAVMALKWAVREMESRYRAMSAVGVRNIEGFNQRMREAQANGEVITRHVQVGYDRQAKEPVYEERPMELRTLPYIVVVVDEMADLMLVAGKEIEAVIQRLAQMARAAGIHLIMATQRPSVDVITGTIKANFPTRISFQVTSKIDSRTILGEAGAEQLVGQGDMLHMAAGGRITRVHGAFVSDREVEALVAQLKTQGEPDYVHSIIEEDADGAPLAEEPAGGGGASPVILEGGFGEGSGDDLYDQAVALVLRENKVSVSFIQRHLQIGYNRSARIVERMETEGLVSAANHVGKREILARGRADGFGDDAR
ncbi:DNA translocase FtsK [Roseospira goensis]|uniref:S-DNA-T family DNA segregation ATPase FtsK/SpoIIIE n=1 Tax=Roseospira goensis TaxID=391922 RepID=A0A7W6RXQ2_9PROT|nr:DNA translocase FtsK [Roseospira goensis]MBB4284981.1 S-DNA-T family DNA segregation ATPase FtsK/SpoIIIE [Roseospira goensis]